MASSSGKGHPVRTGLLILLALLLVGGGVLYFTTNKGKDLLPTMGQASLNISNITREKIQGQMVVQMTNNAPVTLKIDSLRYETFVDGARLAQGRKDQPLVVKKNANNRLQLPLTLNLANLKRKAKTAQQDCVTVKMRTVLYADLPAVGPKEIPVEVSKRVYIPKLPKIEVADVDVTKLGLKKGEATVKLRVINYESIPFTLKQVNYRFQVEDDLDVKGQETKDVTFKKKGTEIMPIRVKFEPKAMPKVLFKSLFKAEKTDYKLTGTATVAAGGADAKDATMNFNSSGTVKDLKEAVKAAKKE
ncbi:MAG TPA: LEA type 2 family protein [Hymenobacter sp.]|jgi:LEA14-like dessication related protein|uniref:LEA type 2 family protein n=1 Tax=Hymenobacter sp. TaxID=1898978 RepID=UPI002ED8B9A2